MNTTKKGNEFEERVYLLLEKAIDEGILGMDGKYCKLRKKPKYYSKERESDIIFDLSIEVWPPGAANYMLLFVVECKNYSHPIPINDLEEFDKKVTQVSGLNAKAVFITNANLQGTGPLYAKNRGIMYIKVYDDNSYKIVLHSSTRKFRVISPTDEFSIIDNQLQKVLNPISDRASIRSQIERLSRNDINRIAKSLINRIDQYILERKRKLPLRELEKYITGELNVGIQKVNSLGKDSAGRKIRAATDLENGVIHVSNQVSQGRSYPFILAHELGHILLHSEIELSQIEYEAFTDAEFSFSSMRYVLTNDRNWLEWQANCFASSIILPDISLLTRLFMFQEQLGMRVGKIYLDDQWANRKSFYQLVEKLAYYFYTTKTSVVYRLNDLDQIDNHSRLKSIGQIIDQNKDEFREYN
ncbi:ImmA/IrrE family metallo-endopeptidase [Lewinella sp. LCG006]|uniref:ImmA/IrrE family metallo-endopeptidase n=1 Tax=Lewinella sp. LCG006 TaxID=3231911 RepID=UPI00346026AC